MKCFSPLLFSLCLLWSVSKGTIISTCGKVTENWPNDDTSVQVGCPSGETINKIAFASFGTPAGSCGTATFANSNCNAANSSSIVSTACLNKNNCTVAVSLANFGDPCVNVTKWLSVQITCTTNDKGPIIHPGPPVWNDSTGKSIQAHGAGFIFAQDNTWYMYGETLKSQDLSQHGVNCYSSKDLVTWTFVGLVLKNSDITNVSTPGPYVVERPKVVYSTSTKQYVLWFHLDNSGYSLRMVGTATAATPSGPFKWVKGFKPDNLGSLDMGLYQEQNAQGQHDGAAYLVRSVENSYVGVSALSADCLSTTGITSTINTAREGPAIFLRNSRYYMVTSHLTGWDPNAMDFFVSNGNTLKNATWTSLGNPTGDSTTFNSQSTFVIPYKQPSGKTLFIYAGDRWNYPDLGDASYIWLPIEVDDTGKFLIPWQDNWEMNAGWPGEL